MVPAAIPQPGLRHGVTEADCVGGNRGDDHARRGSARRPADFVRIAPWSSGSCVASPVPMLTPRKLFKSTPAIWANIRQGHRIRNQFQIKTACGSSFLCGTRGERAPDLWAKVLQLQPLVGIIGTVVV